MNVPWFHLLAVVSLLCPVALRAEDPLQQQLDPAEQQEVTQRIQQFYQNQNDPKGINQIPKKYSPKQKQWVKPNKVLQLKQGQQASLPPGASQEQKQLVQQAQVKATDQFQQHQCKTFIDKKFPKLGCKDPEGRAAAEANDQVENLTDSWIADEDVVRSLDDVKPSGKSKIGIWSDDYWRLRYGATSYRYATAGDFNNYKAAIESYSQPEEWAGILRLPAPKLTEAINLLSPSEKYDIAVGDERFTLTNQQKKEGWGVRGENGDVEDWMGICHGWAPAAFMVPKPVKAVAVVGARGAKMSMYPSDVRALASLAWANGSSDTNFVGGRCDIKKVAMHPNGRIKQQECFDNNPATFHLALANLIGEKQVSFVMDKTFDAEVWNQPIQSYEFIYFNPLNPEKRSKKWGEVAVAYNQAFKAKDRFQKPLTRGVRSGARFDDRAVKKVVGVIASVVYLQEVSPNHGPTPSEDSAARVSYTYDLELTEKGGELVATGGEWHTNVHPDFLWVPKKGDVASSSYDRVAITYTGAKPEKKLTDTATSASGDGYPLCKVLSHMVEKSSGKKYSCK